MNIGILYALNREGHNSIFPLLLYQSKIESSGLKLHFYSSIEKAQKAKLDVLLVSGLSLTKLLGKGSSKFDFLRSLFQARRFPIIYLSGNDSTGPIQKEVIEWVDLYLAKQLLKDLNGYTVPLKRHYFREKMMEQHFFKNQDRFPLISLDQKYLYRLGLSWNLALIDWKTQTNNKLLRYFHIIRRNKSAKFFPVVKPLFQRLISVTFKGNLFPKEHDVSRLHRLITWRVVKAIQGRNADFSSNLSYKEYLKALENTIISPSPFGWGEICYRDFETFIMGALLFKPDMSHMVTFPELFTPENHISYRWDASDLTEKIKAVLDNVEAYQEVADRGKADFEAIFNPTLFGEKFASHFSEIVSKALENFNLRLQNSTLEKQS